MPFMQALLGSPNSLAQARASLTTLCSLVTSYSAQLRAVKSTLNELQQQLGDVRLLASRERMRTLPDHTAQLSTESGAQLSADHAVHLPAGSRSGSLLSGSLGSLGSSLGSSVGSSVSCTSAAIASKSCATVNDN